MKYYFRSCLVLFLVNPVLADQRPLLSLVIDDLGYSLPRGQAAIDLPGSNTFAIIPGTTYGRKLADYAKDQNQEVILHLPLQASDHSVAAEANVLNENMDEVQISNKLQKMLAEYPGIVGVNNHMGSHLTSIDYFMRAIMDGISRFNPRFYFLDSRTTPLSVAYYEAIDSGLESIKRDVFLDNNHQNPESIKLQYQLWLAKARDKGSAIAIGHTHANTHQVLEQYLPEAMESFQLIPISELLTRLDSENDETVHWKQSAQIEAQ